MNKNQIKKLSKKVKQFLELDGNYALGTRLFITNKLEEINEKLFFENGFAKTQETLQAKFADYDLELRAESDFHEVSEYFYFSTIRHGKSVAMNEQFLEDILNTLSARSDGMRAVTLAKKFSLLGYSLKVLFDTSNEISLEDYFSIATDEIYCFTEFFTNADKKPTNKIVETINKLEMNINTMQTERFFDSLAELAMIKAFYNDKNVSKEIIEYLLDKEKEIGILFDESASCILLMAIFMFKSIN